MLVYCGVTERFGAVLLGRMTAGHASAPTLRGRRGGSGLLFRHGSTESKFRGQIFDTPKIIQNKPATSQIE